ncbi:MAG: ABC transporter permease [candidate division WOR-3 bacterium]
MIELKNLSKIYRMGEVEVRALHNINLKINDGEFVAIMGASGSGKSTLLNMLGCLDTPSSGHYLIDNIDVSEFNDSELAQIRNTKIGFIFQSYNLLPRLNAMANVELPLIYSGNYKDRHQKVMSALQMVNLLNRAKHRPKEMSGGEQQRVAIARALANDPSIILADEPTGNLDSKSGQEIMAILKELHQKGITIIMVTHDENVASYAERVIRLKDGEIIEDKQIKSQIHLLARQKLIDDSKTKRRFTLAELKESLSMAIASIFANKLRSFLTMLGIIVGVAAVITMIAIGQGASNQITQRIGQMGANLLMVQPGSFQFGPMRAAPGTMTSLTYEDAQAISKECPSVAKVDAMFSRNAQVVYGNKNTNTSIQGVTENFPEVRNFPIEEGFFISDEDNRYMRRVAVLGKTVVKNLFGDANPIGEYIKIRRVIFQVVGVMSAKGSSGWRDEDDVVFVPLRTAQKRLFGVNHVSMINVMARSPHEMEQAKEEITQLLRKRHRIREGQEDDFNIRSQAEILSTLQETTRTFTILLASIAIVSLIVGGIGIMNIMFVSVTERTKEIGIRKAIGAHKRDILGQFLIESIIVSLSGGLIGILVGILASRLTSQLAGWATMITPAAVLLSFFFAFAVGFFFGFYPARKAALLNPIDALRYE